MANKNKIGKKNSPKRRSTKPKGLMKVTSLQQYAIHFSDLIMSRQT